MVKSTVEQVENRARSDPIYQYSVRLAALTASDKMTDGGQSHSS